MCSSHFCGFFWLVFWTTQETLFFKRRREIPLLVAPSLRFGGAPAERGENPPISARGTRSWSFRRDGARLGTIYLLMGQMDRSVHLGGRLMLKSIPPPIRPPLTPPSASLMPHLPGYPECRVRRSGAPPLLRNVPRPRRAAEVPLPAAPRHVRRNRGAGAMYYVWEVGTGSVLDHEVLKLVNL